MPKFAKVDPYPDYRDGNCRDISGQIVPCGSDFAVSRPKFVEDDEPETAAPEPETEE